MARMNAPAHQKVARGGWRKAGYSKLPQEALCAPRGPFTFLSRLCLWALCVLPWVVVAGWLWRVPTQTRRRRLLRRASRRARLRSQVPRSRRRVPISSPGPASGQGWLGETALDSPSYSVAFPISFPFPSQFAQLAHREWWPGKPTDNAARPWRTTGWLSSEQTVNESFIPVAKRYGAGDRYSSSLVGLRGSCRMHSRS